jgi:chromate transport protein ChrA
MNYGIKMPFEIDDNWLLILRSAYSSRAMIGSAVATIIAAVQTENNYAILAALLAFVALLCRVIVQPVLRKQLETSSECVSKL